MIIAGRYQLKEEVGRGGMGTVWRAYDQVLERTVAVKELRVPTDVALVRREKYRLRAIAEARNAGRISHPNVVIVHDVIASAADKPIYLIMEYLAAPTLQDLVERDGPLSADRVATIGLGILAALRAAHDLDIVHRDVKPSNIHVAQNVVKLVDFGISHAEEDTRLTTSDAIVGTRSYIAPESFGNGPLTGKVDIWSLGATLHYAIAGSHPFYRESTAATLRAILLDPIPAPRCARGLSEAVMALLMRDPAQRASLGEAHRLLSEHARAPIPRTKLERPKTRVEPSAASAAPPKATPAPPKPKAAAKPPAQKRTAKVSASATATVGRRARRASSMWEKVWNVVGVLFVLALVVAAVYFNDKIS